MLGNKVLAKATMKATEEVSKQFGVITEELNKLANITGKNWCLTEAKLFNKVRKISFGQGFICGTAITGIVIAKRKQKDEPKTYELK